MNYNPLHLCALACALASPASVFAQSTPKIRGQQSVAGKQSKTASSHVAAGKPARSKVDAPKPKHLLGDWNKKLEANGFDLGELERAITAFAREMVPERAKDHC